MAEFEATREKYFREITKAEFVAQPPVHHEGDHVGRILGPVKDPALPPIELSVTLAAAKAPISEAILPRPQDQNSGGWMSHCCWHGGYRLFILGSRNNSDALSLAASAP
jgi:hypothetical protein